MSPRPQVHILDDDPTGTQSAAGVPVVTSWIDGFARDIPDSPTVYHMTNSRALPPGDARRMVTKVVNQVETSKVRNDRMFVLRGDSTLRGHLLEEFQGLADALEQAPSTLVLVPAMPDAGRLTRGGVHYARDASGSEIPIAETPYARDPRLGFSKSRLLEWAEERSHGFFQTRSSEEVHLDRVRSDATGAIFTALDKLSKGSSPSVLAIDAVEEADLVLVAEALIGAFEAGYSLAIRSGPPLAALLGNCRSESPIAIPSAARVLVVCGSFVPLAGAQLRHLIERLSIEPVVVPIDDLRNPATKATTQSSGALQMLLDERGIAVLATPREIPPAGADFSDSVTIARNLARIVASLNPRPDLTIVKGGSTAAHVVRHGYGAEVAHVEGNVRTGIPQWQLPDGNRVLIVPGNVGSPSLLADLVAACRITSRGEQALPGRGRR